MRIKSPRMTKAQREALENLTWVGEVWWHDLPAGTRDVLRRRRWIREVRRVACGTHGHTHPGYVGISAAGLRALPLFAPTERV